MKTMTFTYKESSRANELFGAVEMVRTETIHEDGRITGDITGVADGEYQSQHYTRKVSGSVDFVLIRAARELTGWIFHSEGNDDA